MPQIFDGQLPVSHGFWYL